MEDPCSVAFLIFGNKDENDYSHFKELIDHQMYKTFKCHIAHVLIGQSNIDALKLEGFKYKVNIEVENPQLQSALKTE